MGLEREHDSFYILLNTDFGPFGFNDETAKSLINDRGVDQTWFQSHFHQSKSGDWLCEEPSFEVRKHPDLLEIVRDRGPEEVSPKNEESEIHAVEVSLSYRITTFKGRDIIEVFHDQFSTHEE